MKVFWEVLKVGLIMIVLTILTQVGGIVYLLYKPIGLSIEEKVNPRWAKFLLKSLVFFCFLSISSCWILPRFAVGYGRVPLPFFASEELPLKPAGLWICLANRHYVKPALLEAITLASQEINQKYPGTKIIYLDANFPLWDAFPLLPHRSHDDGKKLDICFLYKNARSQARTNNSPTWCRYELKLRTDT